MASSQSYPGAMPPPAGVTPNVVDPPNAYAKIWLATMILCLVIPTILLLLRLYIKARLIKKVTRTDYLFVVAWVFFAAMIGFGFACYDHRVGLHAWNVLPEDFSMFVQFINLVEIVYMPSIFFCKAVILLQYISIFCPSRSSVRWKVVVALIGANAIFFAILMFIEIFQCIPREKIWNQGLPGNCINIEQTFIATAVINVADDICILVLPIAWIWKLQFSFRKKLGIAVIFGAGIFACICSIMRLVFSITNVNNPDITWSVMPIALWAYAEVAMGHIICNMPYLPRLFSRREPTSQPRSKLSSYMSGRRDPLARSSHLRRQYSEVDEYPLTFVEGSPAGSAEGVPPVAGEAKGIELGTMDGQVEVGEGGKEQAGDGGILKTVTIRQSAVRRGS